MSLITLNNTGDDFLEEIFTDLITIYEDIQGSKLVVNWDGSNFEFRTKSVNNDPLSLVDLSLQKYYNKAINFFYSLNDHVKALMPKNWYFIFEYFPDNQPAHIEYTKEPKNSLILTAIVKGNKFKYSVEELLEFANLFDCDPLPIIFHGKLNQKQKEGIKYFLHTSKDDLDYVFGDKNFAFFFYKLLDASREHSFLMDDDNFQPNIQRLIIRTDKNDYKYELLNPLYIKSSEVVQTDFTEIYSLILLNFLSYVQNIEISDIKLVGNRKDDVYINLICKLFNMYMNDTADEIKDFEFEIPKFFSKEKFKINVELIENTLTKKYIAQSDKFEYLFKCILGSFRHKKAKPIGVFTENSLKLFNNFITLIDSHVISFLNKVKEDKLRNSQLMDFDKYKKFQYDIDGAGEVYPDVYTEFESPNDKEKGKKSLYKKGKDLQ